MKEYLRSMYVQAVYERAKENWPREGFEHYGEAIREADDSIRRHEGISYSGLLAYMDACYDWKEQIGYLSFVAGIFVGLELAPYSSETA